MILHFLRTENARKRSARSKEKFVKALAKKLGCSDEKAVDILSKLYKKNPLARDLLREINKVWDMRESIAKKRKELAYVLLVNELVGAVKAGKKLSLVKMRERTASKLGIGKTTLRKLLGEYSRTDKKFAELMILIGKIREENIEEEKVRGKWWKKTKKSVAKRIPTDKEIVRKKIKQFNKEERKYESLLRKRLRQRRPSHRRRKR